MDTAWIGVIGSLGGVLLTSGVALGGTALNHHWQEDSSRKEQEDRLRESRATLRRDAYTRYLIASERLTDYLLVQPPPEDPVELTDSDKVLERLRKLWVSGDKHVQEYLTAQIQIELLAGVEVASAFKEFDDWLEKQVGLALTQHNPLGAGTLDGMDDRRKPLVEAMRAELETDLLPELKRS